MPIKPKEPACRRAKPEVRPKHFGTLDERIARFREAPPPERLIKSGLDGIRLRKGGAVKLVKLESVGMPLFRSKYPFRVVDIYLGGSFIRYAYYDRPASQKAINPRIKNPGIEILKARAKNYGMQVITPEQLESLAKKLRRKKS